MENTVGCSQTCGNTVLCVEKCRSIFLSGEIDIYCATKIIAHLLNFDHVSNEDIFVYINASGAALDAGYTVYDTFQNIKSPVNTICVGNAQSGAGWLLAAGTHGKRFSYPHAEIMMHKIQISELSGSANELEKYVSEVEEDNKIFLEIFARHTGHTLEKVSNDIMEDLNFTPQEALEYGIIDHIISPYKKIPKLKVRENKKRGKYSGK